MAGETRLHIPFATMVKVALFALLCIILVKVWPVLILTLVAVLFAVMLQPVVEFLQRHGMRHGFAIALLGIVIFGILGVFFFVLVPAMGRQIGDLTTALPRVSAQLEGSFPKFAPLIHTMTASARELPSAPQVQAYLKRGATAGMYVVEAVTALVLMLVLALYLLIEGKVALAWILSFFRPEPRAKLARTAYEVTDVILAYMRGQVITCVICGVYAFGVLTLLHVPAALALAVIAFIADLVPVVGTIVMTAPAALLATTVSPMRGLIVIAAYLFYHLVESYFIIPRVYGRTMRLSTLTVLLAVSFGGAVQGALGAVLILPFVAAWPIVERIWFRESLAPDTVPKHDALEGDDERLSDRVADEVIGS